MKISLKTIKYPPVWKMETFGNRKKKLESIMEFINTSRLKFYCARYTVPFELFFVHTSFYIFFSLTHLLKLLFDRITVKERL